MRLSVGPGGADSGSCFYVLRRCAATDTPVVMATPQTNQYLRDAVMQGTPEQLQLMLYDGAIRFALKGRDAIEARDHEQAYESLSRAQKIVLEMDGGLRPEVNREICERMSALYNFVYRKLIHACVHRDTSAIDDALKILRYQRQTWIILLEKITSEVDAGDAERVASRDPACSFSVEG